MAILTKETLDISNSVLAQGGIAVSLDKDDSPELHLKDTLYAGAGLCDEETVRVLVGEAAANIERLCEFGVNFDKKNRDELALTREAAHSMNRIIHAGDTTGKEVCDKLISVVKTRRNINIYERTFVIDLITDNGGCRGVLAYNEDAGQYRLFVTNGDLRNRRVWAAFQGYHQSGGCYRRRYAWPIGQEPTLWIWNSYSSTRPYCIIPKNRNFLISEAVRGEGALIKDMEGKRFMSGYHPMGGTCPKRRGFPGNFRRNEEDRLYPCLSGHCLQGQRIP